MAVETSGRKVARVGIPGFGKTEREDRWWLGPLVAALAFLAFIVYSTIVVFAGSDYAWGPYLSPYYSPFFKPDWFPLSSALLVAWIPGVFRLSCYYYRKAYYRSIALSPAACAVSEPKRNYTGETAAPLSWLPIIHRWTLYLSIIVVVFLWIDAIRAFDWDGHFGIGLGTVIMVANVILLSGFTFGCHALRSAVGGNVRCFSCAQGGAVRYKMWRGVSALNAFHQNWAWFSLTSVALTDLYIRLVAAGVIADPHFVI
jgi:hypothetical protein